MLKKFAPLHQVRMSLLSFRVGLEQRFILGRQMQLKGAVRRSHGRLHLPPAQLCGYLKLMVFNEVVVGMK
jgi:hypothetical protein